MTVNEMRASIETLESIQTEIQKEIKAIEGREPTADIIKTVQNNSQIAGLNKSLIYIDKKIEDLKLEICMELGENESDEPVKELSIPERFDKLIRLLREGKKVKINRNYVGSQVPHIKLNFKCGYETIKLDCCETHEFNNYKVHTGYPIDSISVVGYGVTGKCVKIEYIYANSQMNRLFAHLEDGRDVDYSLCILDIWAVGEEPEVVGTTEATLQFFQLSDQIGNRKMIAEEKRSYPENWEIGQIIDNIKKYESAYKGADILVNCDSLGCKSLIFSSERKCEYRY